MLLYQEICETYAYQRLLLIIMIDYLKLSNCLSLGDFARILRKRDRSLKSKARYKLITNHAPAALLVSLGLCPLL